MKEKIKEYLNVTIQTKKGMRKRIVELEKSEKEARDNEKDVLLQLNKYKKKFVELDKLNKQLEIENEQLKKDAKKLNRKLKKTEKELEIEQGANENLQIDLEHSEEKYRDLEQDLHDNYRRIPVEEQYEISNRDFI